MQKISSKHNPKVNYPVKIEEIYGPHLYSVTYGRSKFCELDRLLCEWSDMEKVLDFFEENGSCLSSDFWNGSLTPEAATNQVLQEAADLEDYLYELAKNADKGATPDFDSFFHCLDGEFYADIENIPVKAYGRQRPALLRLYAIKLDSNCYLITGGGIKLKRTIQDSPGMEKILPNIRKVKTWLKNEGFEPQSQ